jgi:hypothetical protein
MEGVIYNPKRHQKKASISSISSDASTAPTTTPPSRTASPPPPAVPYELSGYETHLGYEWFSDTKPVDASKKKPAAPKPPSEFGFALGRPVEFPLPRSRAPSNPLAPWEVRPAEGFSHTLTHLNNHKRMEGEVAVGRRESISGDKKVEPPKA